jgi:hypothetical protein
LEQANIKNVKMMLFLLFADFLKQKDKILKIIGSANKCTTKVHNDTPFLLLVFFNLIGSLLSTVD